MSWWINIILIWVGGSIVVLLSACIFFIHENHKLNRRKKRYERRKLD